MKIRNGFVSNSSSSSFLLFGLYFDSESEIRQLMGLNDQEEKDGDEGDEGEEESLYDALYDRSGDAGLEFHNPDGYGYYIGASWDDVGDDETGKQFKERVREALKKILPKADEAALAQAGTHSYAWYC